MTTRNTNQRLKILEYLRSVHCHPTAETVYEEVRKELPAISKGTVYRNLQLLTKQGKVMRLEVNKEYRFDADCRCHQHFVCTGCGRIVDIHDEQIGKQALRRFKSSECFPESVCITFKGKCKRCR
jgi:Fe2+ or Zn2+ uptake regulation protein